MSTAIATNKSLKTISKSAFEIGRKSVEKQQFALDVPKDSEDFVYIPFRHISSGIVGQGTRKSTEFPPEVLKASLPLFKNLHVYTNHWQYVGNEIGSVLTPQWTEAYTLPNGKQVPSGIEAVIEIDNVLYKDFARKLTKWAVKLHSVSVGISFKFKRSHEEMTDEEFDRNRGKMVEGNEVRLIATEVTKYWETSIVYEGADSNAKRIGTDGKIEVYKSEVKESEDVETVYSAFELPVESNQPELFNDMTDNKKKVATPAKTVETENLQADKVVVDAQVETDKVEEPTQELNAEQGEPLEGFIFSFLDEGKEDFAEQLSAAIAERGLSVVDTESYNTAVTELETIKAQFSQQAAEITTLQASVSKVTEQFAAQKVLTNEAQNQLAAQQENRQNLEAELETLKAEREAEKVIYSLGVENLNSLRATAKKEYEIFAREDADQDVIAKIEAETSAKELETLIKGYSGKASEKFGSRCEDCGSDKVAYRSSAPQSDGHDADGKEARTESFANFGARFRKHD